MTHTPGPWLIDPISDDRVILLDNCDGAVGEVVYADTRNPADARLIAAAPDLLAALQTLLDDPYLSDPINNERMAAARAAIARATG